MCEKPVEDNRVCCKIFGLGAEMVEVNVKYEWTTPEACRTPRGVEGGGMEIVDDKYCEGIVDRIMDILGGG